MATDIENGRRLRGDSLRMPAVLAFTAVYAAVVSWGAAHHEPWRDEVAALSIARQAHSLAELAAPLRFEGHPILWYLVLWLGWMVVGRTWVLKASSVGCAVGAVFLLARSPLAWWLKLLFAFSYFPLYQYSVISRGYGLEMLMLFAFCTLYPYRRSHPVALAFVLAALANTEAFGLIMTVAAAVMLGVETIMSGVSWRSIVGDRRAVSSVGIYLVGLALAARVAFPDPGHPLTGFERLDFWTIASRVGQAIAEPVGHLAPLIVLPAPSLFVWGYFVYLAGRPSVLCFTAAALIGIESLFNIVYGPGAPWHTGNLMLVLVASMWLDASASTPAIRLPPAVEQARVWLGRSLAVAMAIVLGTQSVLGAEDLIADIRYDYSANRRLADLLRSEPSLATAVLTGEPDPPLWSVSYYADNRIYLPREDVFRAWGMFGQHRLVEYDLGSLLAAARRIRADCGCPAVITLGWPLAQPGTYGNFRGTRFEERFVITAEARDEFLASTRLLARLGPTITDENYDVYVLR